MTNLHLKAHPVTPCPWIDVVTVTIERHGSGSVNCRYQVSGDIRRLRVPPTTVHPVRADELWRHTCFELFAREAPGSPYFEFNFCTSGNWSAYGFAGYRQGMRNLADASVVVTCAQEEGSLMLMATISSPALGVEPMQMGASAVIEDQDGRICYWALNHPDGRPDFHHDAGFDALI